MNDHWISNILIYVKILKFTQNTDVFVRKIIRVHSKNSRKTALLFICFHCHPPSFINSSPLFNILQESLDVFLSLACLSVRPRFYFHKYFWNASEFILIYGLLHVFQTENGTIGQNTKKQKQNILINFRTNYHRGIKLTPIKLYYCVL